MTSAISTKARCSCLPPAAIDDSKKSAVSHRATFLIEARALALYTARIQDALHLSSGAQDLLVGS